MSEDSRKERERLKEEYKEHYLKMLEAKKKLDRVRRERDITGALRNMDSSELIDSFDDFLFAVKSKIAGAEARLEAAMENLTAGGEQPDTVEVPEDDEELQKIRAKETLKQIKLEMGQLYGEIEEQARTIQVRKTIGTQDEVDSAEDKKN